MTATRDEELKAEMLRVMRRADATRWSLPIINKLEARSLGFAFPWACAFVRSQLARFMCGETLAERERWLAELLEIAATREPAGKLEVKARDVWYHKGRRDGAQTAIARLYEALGRLIAGDGVRYGRILGMAVSVAASDVDGNIVPAAVDKMVELYNKWESCK